MLKYDDINIYFLTASGRLTDTPEHLRKNGIPKLPKTKCFPDTALYRNLKWKGKELNHLKHS